MFFVYDRTDKADMQTNILLLCIHIQIADSLLYYWNELVCNLVFKFVFSYKCDALFMCNWDFALYVKNGLRDHHLYTVV